MSVLNLSEASVFPSQNHRAQYNQKTGIKALLRNLTFLFLMLSGLLLVSGVVWCVNHSLEELEILKTLWIQHIALYKNAYFTTSNEGGVRDSQYVEVRMVMVKVIP